MNILMRGLCPVLFLLAFAPAQAVVMAKTALPQTTGAARAIPPVFDKKNDATAADFLLPGFLEKKSPIGFVRSKRMQQRRKGRGAMLTIVVLLLVIVILVLLL